MNAARVHWIGPPSVIAIETIGVLEPGGGEELVRVAAADRPCDTLIRTGSTYLTDAARYECNLSRLCVYRKSDLAILVVKSTENRPRNDGTEAQSPR
jgi:hypothetical protein